MFLFRREVGYLGHIISAEDVRTNPEMISTVKDWSRTEDVHQLWKFSWTMHVLQEICQGIFKYCQNLHKLIEVKQFLRIDEWEEAFGQQKKEFTYSPGLAYPQPDKLFILDTDASNESVRAVLSQEIDDREYVIAN
ncbi:retrovirus-related Pol polyprotein from transposon 412 [Nephila pilipes]|uniref:Retrovirus-related Pol polyprotein from transposon 412 n=1 Tax=Nephila pilipes TaxID=299642 RepID=A0A8X6NSX0_NEPPI|nr:retrovirus-related Pol polyprotein from transposon 412 [Nephila pilipes]